MFGWNKTKKHNQDSPTNQKVHKEFNFQCFRSETWLQSVICFATQDGTECCEKPSLLSLLGPPCGKRWERQATQLQASWQDVGLRSPASRTP